MIDTLLWALDAVRWAGAFAFVYCFSVFVTGGVCGMTQVREDEEMPVIGAGTGDA